MIIINVSKFTVISQKNHFLGKKDSNFEVPICIRGISMNANEMTESFEKIDQGPRFITIAELVKKTTLSRPTINRYIKNGTIPVVRIGRRVIIDAEFLSHLKKQSTISVEEGKK